MMNDLEKVVICRISGFKVFGVCLLIDMAGWK